MTAPATVRRGPRVIVGVVTALIIGVAVTWWVTRADERRVDTACDTYLKHRENLRTVLREVDEAVGRAVAAKSRRVEDKYFNDAGQVRSWVGQWLRESPKVLASLDHNADASRLERGAVQSLRFVAAGLVELRSQLAKSQPNDVRYWLPDFAARMQMVDDSCLAAARSSFL